MTTSLILLQAGGANGLANIGMIVLLVVVFYFFMIRPQTKRQKEIRKFRESLAVGDNIVTAGGIYGKVRGIKGDVFVVEIANGVKISVDKNSVYPSAQEALKDAEGEQKTPNN